MRTGWNHNLHYHGLIMDAVPPGCRRALDVGCGQGVLARKLAGKCGQVVGIDRDAPTLAAARAATAELNVSYIHGDVMSDPLEPAGFDLIVAVATLHHLPLHPALERFRELLAPGGTLVIVGLFRMHTPLDYIVALVAEPISRVRRLTYGVPGVGAPLAEPKETLSEIRQACAAVFPTGEFRRRLFHRYSILVSYDRSRNKSANR